jgi:hypothetical protein
MSKTGAVGPPSVPDLDEVLRNRLSGGTPEPPAPPPVAAPSPSREQPRAIVEPEADDELFPDEPAPQGSRGATQVGRAGRGKVNALLYMSSTYADELAKFADDVFHGTRGAVKRWQVIDAVVRPGLTEAGKARILKRLGVAKLPKWEGE